MVPICIITPSKMICSSSPLTLHGPEGRSCSTAFENPMASKAQEVKRLIGKAGCTPEEVETIGTVVELMLAAGARRVEAFTIVCPGEPRGEAGA
jgi:hypothetical protein